MEKKSTKKTTVTAPVIEDLGKCLEDNEFSEFQRQGFLISEDGVLKGFFGRDAEVTVPDVVTEIGDNVFQGKRLTSLVLPSSVQKIGKSIFRDCAQDITVTLCAAVGKLTPSFTFFKGSLSLVFKEGVQEIPKQALNGCKSLTSVKIPYGVATIGEGAFKDCVRLRSVSLPSSVRTIGREAFLGCKNLTAATMQAGLQKIDTKAFCGCESLASVVIPDSVQEIWSYAFEDCKALSSVTLSSSLQSIPYAAFQRCASLTSVTIPDGVKRIGCFAFEGCASLTEAVIPKSVTEIEKEAFCGCEKLKRIRYGGKLKDWHNIVFGERWERGASSHELLCEGK